MAVLEQIVANLPKVCKSWTMFLNVPKISSPGADFDERFEDLGVLEQILLNVFRTRKWQINRLNRFWMRPARLFMEQSTIKSIRFIHKCTTRTK